MLLYIDVQLLYVVVYFILDQQALHWLQAGRRSRSAGRQGDPGLPDAECQAMRM